MSKLYAGDITPNDAWEILKSDSGAMLIDVRTTAEWHFVGTPDLASLNKKTIFFLTNAFCLLANALLKK